MTENVLATILGKSPAVKAKTSTKVYLNFDTSDPEDNATLVKLVKIAEALHRIQYGGIANMQTKVVKQTFAEAVALIDTVTLAKQVEDYIKSKAGK